MDGIDNSTALRILLVEDSEHDVAAFHRAMRNCDSPCRIAHCSRAEEALEQAASRADLIDLIVTDQNLPGMNGLELCEEILRQQIELPMVLLTGKGSENLAVQALKAGVDDYMVKDSDHGFLDLLPVVLPDVVRRHRERIAGRKAEAERARLIVELQDALSQIKTLSGIIPICMICKKIRDDKGYWDQLEAYLQTHSQAEFSHGICPGCYEVELAKVKDS